MTKPSELKARLASIGKKRKWLTEVTAYKIDAVNQAFSAKSRHRTDQLVSAIETAISNEETARLLAKHELMGVIPLRFATAQFARIDSASRKIQSPTLSDFCHEAVLLRVNEIMFSGKPIAAAEFEEKTPARLSL